MVPPPVHPYTMLNKICVSNAYITQVFARKGGEMGGVEESTCIVLSLRRKSMTLLCVVIQSVSPEFNALSKPGNSTSFGEARVIVVDMPEKSGILSIAEHSS